MAVFLKKFFSWQKLGFVEKSRKVEFWVWVQTFFLFKLLLFNVSSVPSEPGDLLVFRFIEVPFQSNHMLLHKVFDWEHQTKIRNHVLVLFESSQLFLLYWEFRRSNIIGKLDTNRAKFDFSFALILSFWKYFSILLKTKTTNNLTEQSLYKMQSEHEMLILGKILCAPLQLYFNWLHFRTQNKTKLTKSGSQKFMNIVV